MSENKGSAERFDYINEMLTGEELLERLAAAQEVVSGLQARVNLGNTVIESYKNTLAERDRDIASLQGFMVRISRKLAAAGGYAHKEKNEVLLSVVADLLTSGIRTFGGSDMDDLPF